MLKQISVKEVLHVSQKFMLQNSCSVQIHASL